jgi:hypothetical protein
MVVAHGTLEQAIAEKLAGVLTLPGTAPGREWKVRLLSAEPNGPALWIQALDESKGELNVAISNASKAELAFTSGTRRACFQTVIQKRNRHYWLTDSMVIEALLLKWPTEVRDGERRKHARYAVGDESRVLAQLVRTSQWAPAGEREFRVKLSNISLGGAGFLTSLNNLLLALPSGEPMKVTIQYDGRRFDVPATLAANRTRSGTMLKFGVEFEADRAQWSPEAEQGLQDLIAALARREALRTKARVATKAS